MLRSNTFVHRILKTATELRKQKPKCLNDDNNVVKDDGLGDGEASEDEGLGVGEAVEDTDDLGDDDAEDVIEDNDNLGNADVDVAAVSACSLCVNLNSCLRHFL